MSWTTYSVGDLCEVFDGPHATPAPSAEGPIYLGISSIGSDGAIDFENSKRISYEDYPKWTKRVVPQEDDVVFSYEANLNSFAIIPRGFEGCLGRRMAIMRPNKEKVLPRFLYYYLLSPKWKSIIAQKTVLGATVNRIPIASYPSFPIEIPDFEEQERIAGILSTYDSLIENNRKQIKLLEEAAQRLYKEWFIDLRFPGHEMAEIDSGTRLPKGWVRRKLYETIDVVRGVSYTSDTLSAARGKRLLNLGNIMPFGGFRDGYEKYYLGRYGEHHVLSSGDVVLGLTEQAEGLAGYAARVPSYLEGSLFSADLALLKPRQLASEYLYASLRYGNISRALSPFASGAKIKHLKPDHLRGVHIIVPNQSTIVGFTERVRKLLIKQDICRQEIQRLTEARNRLIPMLLSTKEAI